MNKPVFTFASKQKNISTRGHNTPLKVIIKHDSVISPNLAAADKSDVSVYPSTCFVGETVVCVYRRGAAKHSRDGILLAQSSTDGGNSWSEPVSVFDRIQAEEPESVHTGVVCAHGSDAVAFFKTVEVDKPDAYIFSEEGRRLRQRAYMCRSEDFGHSWSTPAELEIKDGPRDTFLGSRPLNLPGGRLLIPVEATGDHGQQYMMGCFSEDGGRTLSPLFTIMHDSSGKLGFGDGKIAILSDGGIVMLAWTYLNATEETIQVHRSVSSDGGYTWSPPEPTNIVCQIMAPLALADGSLVAAGNVRVSGEGIRLYQSLDSGRTWSGSPIQMWDAKQAKVIGAPLAIEDAPASSRKIWSELPSFTFGSPELTMLSDGDILLTYYAVVNDITHVRACRFTFC